MRKHVRMNYSHEQSRLPRTIPGLFFALFCVPSPNNNKEPSKELAVPDCAMACTTLLATCFAAALTRTRGVGHTAAVKT